MTNRDIDQLTGAFAYAIAALDAQAADKNGSLALCNKVNQCWDELLTEREALLKIARAVATWGDHVAPEFLSPHDCPHCELPARDDKDWPIIEHLPDCPVTQARALLGEEQP